MKTELGFTSEDRKDICSCARCGKLLKSLSMICCDQCWIEVEGVNRLTGLHNASKLVNVPKLPTKTFDDFMSRVRKLVMDLRSEIKLNPDFNTEQALDVAKFDENYIRTAALSYILEHGRQM